MLALSIGIGSLSQTIRADSINATDFVITIKTNNSGPSGSTSFAIPVRSGYTYNYNVDWDNDGVVDQTGLTTSTTHNYGTAGTYTLRISGTFPAIYFNNAGDKAKLLSIDQWGTGQWLSFENAFYGCSSLTSAATDTANTASVTNMRNAFNAVTSFNSDISGWDTSNVTDMGYMFYNTRFDQNIGSWNTGKVTNMEYMFSSYLSPAFNQPIGNWDTSNVTTMKSMLANSFFNQDISGWNTSKLVNMSGMFGSAFNQPIGGWNTANVTDMSSTFQSSSKFNQDISGWNTSKVTTMEKMFYSASVFNQNLSAWDTSSVTNMSYMFANASVFNNANASGIGAWNTAKVTNMSDTFMGARVFNQPIGSWNTGAVTTMNYMFAHATTFNQPIGNWNTSKVTDMGYMFYDAAVFDQNIGAWDVTNVTVMGMMFQEAEIFNNGGSNAINTWNTLKVTDMGSMFKGAISFNQPIGGWNVSSAINMSSMFDGASAFNSGGSNAINTWNTLKVTNMSYMFNNATVFNQPIGGWNVSKVTNMSTMFNNAIAFNNGGSDNINNWSPSLVTNMGSMFKGAISFNQPIGGWNVSSVTTMYLMFNGATAFNNGGSDNINNWSPLKVTTMQDLFNGASSFNQPIGGWNVSSVTNMNYMFRNATAFNNGGSDNISNWSTSKVTSLYYTFYNATAFNQSLAGWNIESVVTYSSYNSMFEMLSNTGMSRANYDATLAGWSTQNVKTGVRLGAAGLTYCSSTDARSSLITTKNWKVIGDRLCEPIITTADALTVAPITGTGGAGSVVTLTTDSISYTATVDSDGYWTVAAPQSLWQTGTLALSVTATDQALFSAPTTTTGVSAGDYSISATDTGSAIIVSPVTPVITAPTTGSFIAIATPTISGTGESGATITVTDASITICTAVVADGGVWSCTPDTNLNDGSYTLVATQTYSGYSTSQVSASISLTVDTTAPASPTIASPIVGAVISNTTPAFSGGGEPGASVTVKEGALTHCTATVQSNGTWSCTVSSSLGEGSHDFVVIQTDDAGNLSVGTTITVTIDTSAPAAPYVISPTTGITTSNAAPTLSGTGEPSALITVKEGETTRCTAYVQGDGSWSCTTTPTLSDGSHNFAISQTDAAGNTSAATGLVVTVDTTPPLAPGITSPAADATIPDTTPLVTGTGEPGAHVIVKEGGQVLCDATVQGDGAWSCEVQVALSDGDYSISVTQMDTVGNTSPATVRAVTIGPLTQAFDFSTDITGDASAPVRAQLSVTSSLCYSITTETAQLLGVDGITAPESRVVILGGIAYSLSCTAVGGSAVATISLGAHYDDLAQMRIYKKTTAGSLEDITNQVALFNAAGPGDTVVTMLRYTLIDGGEYDEDGTENSVIVDPLYIGIVQADTSGEGSGNTVQGGSSSVATGGVTLSNTGTPLYIVLGSTLVLVAAGSILLRRAFVANKR